MSIGIEYYTEASELFSYDSETGIFTKKTSYKGSRGSIGDVAGTTHKKGYRELSATVNKVRKKLKAHRVAWFMVHGELPDQVDHINQDRGDNRMVNLRACTNGQNKINTGIAKNNTSGHKCIGYYDEKGRNNKWMVKITKDKKVFRRWYSTLEEAIVARDVFYDVAHGEFVPK